MGVRHLSSRSMTTRCHVSDGGWLWLILVTVLALAIIPGRRCKSSHTTEGQTSNPVQSHPEWGHGVGWLGTPDWYVTFGIGANPELYARSDRCRWRGAVSARALAQS